VKEIKTEIKGPRLLDSRLPGELRLSRVCPEIFVPFQGVYRPNSSYLVEPEDFKKLARLNIQFVWGDHRTQTETAPFNYQHVLWSRCCHVFGPLVRFT
jgi:hypothetical protein